VERGVKIAKREREGVSDVSFPGCVFVLAKASMVARLEMGRAGMIDKASEYVCI
jgi:hypothetical protein